MDIGPFYIDETPVTNFQFQLFLQSAGYEPQRPEAYLRHWKQYPNGTFSYPEGWENKPVVWVSRKDAEAYARWSSKRLPSEWEWQLAAQLTNKGPDRRPYPWGEGDCDSERCPTPLTSRQPGPVDDVMQHPDVRFFPLLAVPLLFSIDGVYFFYTCCVVVLLALRRAGKVLAGHLRPGRAGVANDGRVLRCAYVRYRPQRRQSMESRK